MENQPIKLNKAIKISIIAGALIVALSIAYYLVIFLPQREKTRIEQQKQEQEARKECNKRAVEKGRNAGSGQEAVFIHDAVFEACLNEKGF